MVTSDNTDQHMRLNLLYTSGVLRLGGVLSFALLGPRHGQRSLASLRAQPNVLVAIATGSEEIETACVTDTLTRGGARVTVASVEGRASLTVTMSRGLRISADCGIEDCEGKDWALVVCPGGMPGAERLRDSPALARILKAQKQTGRPLAAVCAAPAVVLAHHSLLGSSKATCYPSPAFTGALGDAYVDPVSGVVVGGNVITSQGVGTSLPFALTLVDLLFGAKKAKEVAEQMLVKFPVA